MKDNLRQELKEAQERLKQNKVELTPPTGLDFAAQTWLELEQKQLKDNIKSIKSQLKRLAT